MGVNKQTIDKVIKILHEEIVAAEGCTEPIAIAYVAAKAKEILEKTPDSLKVYVSGNMIKNVKSVVVPNSGGMVGVKAAAAMGVIVGKTQKGLMVISDVNEADMLQIRNFLDHCPIEIIHEKASIKLYVRIESI